MQKFWKTIGEIILATIGSFLSILCFLILLLVFTAPGAVATLTHSMGMYGQSAWLASVQYADGKGDISYIADAMTYSIEQKNDEKIVEYGERLLADARFAEYCETRDAEGAETYDQFVYGQLGIAYYRLEEKEKAVEKVFSAIGSEFSQTNAVTDLTYVVIVNRDRETAKDILDGVLALQESGKIEDDTYLSKLASSLKKFTE